MRTSTRQDEAPAAGSRREEYYETDLGVGRLVLAGDLPLEHWLPDPGRAAPPAAAPPGPWTLALRRYFAGEPVAFDLDVVAYAGALGLTAFETAVYAALAGVPWGTAVSYRDLAAVAGHPNAYRAVGSTMARNELPVILPCHRVVKNDGRLGFYGDDPAWKARLLELEGVAVRRDPSDPTRSSIERRP
jgi:methylated-DNA-[protein]-cysteine S-methyltransferase